MFFTYKHKLYVVYLYIKVYKFLIYRTLAIPKVIP